MVYQTDSGCFQRESIWQSTSNADSSSGDSNVWAWELGVIFRAIILFPCFSVSGPHGNTIHSHNEQNHLGAVSNFRFRRRLSLLMLTLASTLLLFHLAVLWAIARWYRRHLALEIIWIFCKARLFRCERGPFFWWATPSLLCGWLEKELLQNSISRQRMENQGSPSRFEMK